MTDLAGRESRLLDLSQVRYGRSKGTGIHVNENNWGRCSAALSEWISNANTQHGGTTPFPYGLYLLNGQIEALQDPPPDLADGPFLELLPCDRPDRRAAKLTWNESGTEASFSFTALANLLGIHAPKGTTLWLDAVAVKDLNGKPVMALPVGHRIKVQPVQTVAASNQGQAKGGQ